MNPMTILKVMKRYKLGYVYLVEVNDGKYVLKSNYDPNGKKISKADVQMAIKNNVTFLE